MRRLKEALWQRIQQLGKAQSALPEEPAPATLSFQVQHLGTTATMSLPSARQHTSA